MRDRAGSRLYDDQLDFGIRQESYIRDTVTVAGCDYRTPFLNSHWLEFMLNVPRSYRYKQALYHKILIRAFPEMYSLPTRNTFGLTLDATEFRLFVKRVGRKAVETMHKIGCRLGVRRGKTSPRTLKYMGYIDFSEGFRQRKDLIELAEENIADLAKRDIITWVDIEKLWEQHRERIHDHGDSISMIVSAEILLKASNHS
ncbi:MAG: hypothetical protein ACYSWO_24915 [Planctomycetota bacterium]